VQQRVKNTDAGAEITRLDDYVGVIQGFDQQRALGPPLAVLLGDDGADPVQGDHPLGARDSIFQKRMSTV
jgi:hypothetical protein